MRREEEDAEWVRLIRELEEEEEQYRYGSLREKDPRRRDYGKRVSGKKAARLMREPGLHAPRRRKCIPRTNANPGLPVGEKLLDRPFHAQAGGEKWVFDSMERCTIGGGVYLTVVLDLFDRKVMGWAVSGDRESVHTTIPAVEMAFANRKAQDGLLFHSDRGVQYWAKAFRETRPFGAPAHELRRGTVGTMPGRKHVSKP